MLTLHDDQFLKIQATSAPQGGACRIMLCFLGIGFGFGGVAVQKPEFFRVGSNYDAMIFISDKTRSWANALDKDQLKSLLAPYLDGNEVHAIGNSLGGFLAIWASSFLPISKCVSFAPQYCMNPKAPPFETRWARYHTAIDDWTVESLDGCFQDTTEYFVITTLHEKDAGHVALMPVARNIKRMVVPVEDHNPAAALKSLKLLHPMLIEAYGTGVDQGWIDRKIFVARVRRYIRRFPKRMKRMLGKTA